MAALLALALVALSALFAEGSLLPPGGCEPAVCYSYSGMKFPGGGDWSVESTWVDPYDKLAFVRESFNKKLKIGGVSQDGPGALNPTTWEGLLHLYDAPHKGAHVPSLNFGWFQIDGNTTHAALAAYNGNGGIPQCCNACAAMTGCHMYLYVPRSDTLPDEGVPLTDIEADCVFISGGASTTDGPFLWGSQSEGASQLGSTSKGSPKTLSSDATVDSDSSTETFRQTSDGTFALGFLGGACSGNKPTVVKDEPHSTGAHNTLSDFNGELNKAFCLVTDRKIHLNVVLKGYKTESAESADAHPIRSWIKEVGLIWNDAQQQQHTLHLVARAGKDTARGNGFLASASFDGQAIEIPEVAGSSFQAADLTFSFIGTTKRGWYDLDQFRVIINTQMDMGLSMRVAHPKLRTPTDAEVHFHLMFNDVKLTPRVHGVLGQTFRDTQSQIMKAVKYSVLHRLLRTPVKASGSSGAGFLQGQVADYESSDVLKADCKMSTFAA